MERWFGLVEAVSFFGLAFAFYFWQRRSLARDVAERLERERREREAAGDGGRSAAPPGHPEG